MLVAGAAPQQDKQFRFGRYGKPRDTCPVSTKVFIYPTPDRVDENSGIGRVVHAQFKHLPEQGIEIVDEWRRADVIALHTQQVPA